MTSGIEKVWFDSFNIRISTIRLYRQTRTVDHKFKSTTTNGPMQVHSAQSYLVVTHASTNRRRLALTSVNVPLS